MTVTRIVGRTSTLFPLLLREEWRLHSRLFGGVRFGLFPLVITGIVAVGSLALAQTGYAPADVVLGVHAMAAAFGLYSGTAGFAGSDILEDVIGEVSLLLATTETLPLDRRGMLGVFLLKDFAFYGIMIVLPIAIGMVGIYGVTVTALGQITLTWLSLCLVFGAGMSLTVAGIAAGTRGIPGWLIGLALGLVVVGVWWSGSLPTVIALIVPLQAGVLGTVTLLGGTVVIGGVALTVYDPTFGRPERTAVDRFARVNSMVTVDNDGLLTKTLLDLTRSSGGVAKPIVSVMVLLVLVAALVGIVETITGVAPAPGIFFGGILGLSAFTTYNWLTQNDSVEEYLILPVSVRDIFGAKWLAFLVVGAPTVALPYLAAVLFFDAMAIDAVAGAFVLGGFGLYYYGLTVYIAGFEPNEFLFDALRFSLFTLGVAVPLVPTLVTGFVVVPPSLPIAGAIAVAGVVFGAVGVGLSAGASGRWEKRYRAG